MEAFREFADLAASHHERLDGKGYYRGLAGVQLSPAARALAVADVYEALSAKRPYRADLTEGDVMQIITKNAEGGGVCPAALEGLWCFVRSSGFVPYRIAA